MQQSGIVLTILAASLVVACATGPNEEPDQTCHASIVMFDGNGGGLPATPQVAVHGTVALSAAIVNASSSCATALLNWTTSTGSASVVRTGTSTATLTGVSPSSAVTVSVSYGGAIASVVFAVVAGPLHHISILGASSMTVGGVQTLGVELQDLDGFPTGTAPAPGSVTWSMPATAVMSLSSSGFLTALAPGTATITATYAGVVPNLTAQMVVGVSAIPITSVTVDPTSASVAVGATVFPPLKAIIKNQNGVIVQPPLATVSWQSLNPSIATVGAVSGTITGVAAGMVTIRAVYDGNVSVFGDAQITVTAPAPTASLIAFALADQPAAASYTPDPAYQYNGQGGTITVARSGTGQYTVTIPSFGGAAGASRIPFVNAVGVVGVVCLPISWIMIGVTDATVRVDCSGSGGALTDSKFTIFAVGEAGLPGRFAFANSGALPAGFAPVNLGSASAWSSSLASPQITRDNINVVGRFQLALKSASSVNIDVPIVQPTGSTGARCQVNAWSAAIEVVCFPVGSVVFADAQFSGMLLDQGRAGKRFGAVHSSFPVVGRNSAGGTNTVTQTGTGTYRVVFANLGRPAGGKETVLVSAQALAIAVVCNPSVWTTVGNDLVVDVACFNAAGAASNIPAFSAVVIE